MKDRIRAAALATPALAAILGTSPFRWFDRQLVQGTAFPAVQVQIVSDPSDYCYTGQLPTSQSRYQFTLSALNKALGADGVPGLVALEAAMNTFFNSLDLIGIPGLVQYPNRIVAARDGFKAAPSPGITQRILDVMIFANNQI